MDWLDFAAPLRTFITRRAPAGVDAEDLLHDVFVRIQEQLPGLRDADRIDAWIFQIARNVLADAFRHRGRRDALVERSAHEPRPEPDGDERTAAAALASCVTPMVFELAEPYREAIMLTELCGMTQVEAARHVGISISGMKSRVQRGREQLARIIGGTCRVERDVRGRVIECESLRPSACPRDSMGMTNTNDDANQNQNRSRESADPGCCGGAAPTGSGACCALDAEVKQSGGTGCGCSSKAAPAAAPARKGCC